MNVFFHLQFAQTKSVVVCWCFFFETRSHGERVCVLSSFCTKTSLVNHARCWNWKPWRATLFAHRDFARNQVFSLWLNFFFWSSGLWRGSVLAHRHFARKHIFSLSLFCGLWKPRRITFIAHQYFPETQLSSFPPFFFLKWGAVRRERIAGLLFAEKRFF